MADLTWYPIEEAFSTKIIGAAAYEGDKLAVVTAFYDDKDMDSSGDLDFLERFNPFGMNGRAIAACFTGLKSNPDLWQKDPNAVNTGWGSAFVSFATGLAADGIYMVYFNHAVQKVAGLAAQGLTGNPVKSFVIRKGMEQTVKSAYRDGTR